MSQSFGPKLKELRKTNHVTRDTLAAAIGVSKRAIVDWELNGRHPLRYNVYTKIAEYFSCDVSYLIDTEDEILSNRLQEQSVLQSKPALDFFEQVSEFGQNIKNPEDFNRVMLKIREVLQKSVKYELPPADDHVKHALDALKPNKEIHELFLSEASLNPFDILHGFGVVFTGEHSPEHTDDIIPPRGEMIFAEEGITCYMPEDLSETLKTILAARYLWFFLHKPRYKGTLWFQNITFHAGISHKNNDGMATYSDEKASLIFAADLLIADKTAIQADFKGFPGTDYSMGEYNHLTDFKMMSLKKRGYMPVYPPMQVVKLY